MKPNGVGAIQAIIIKDELFKNGLNAFENHQFYDAHEYWEDLWSDYKLEEPDIIQGLIQVSVGFFHLTKTFLQFFLQ